MSDKVVITFKGTKIMREALRMRAFEQGHSSASKTITQALLSDPLFVKELKKAEKKLAKN